MARVIALRVMGRGFYEVRGLNLLLGLLIRFHNLLNNK